MAKDNTRLWWTVPLVIALAGTGLWAANAGDYFRSDDFVSLAGASTAPWTYFTGENLGGSPFFRPGMLVSIWIERKLWGLSPLGYHITNLLLYAGIVVLFHLLLTRLFRDPTFAALAALIFALHPAHGDCVGWISGRTELLLAFFSLLTLVAFLTFRAGKKNRILWYLVSLTACACALTGKENGVMLPFLVVAVDVIRSNNQRIALRRRLFVYLPFFLVLANYLVVRTVVLGGLGGYGELHTQFGLFVLRNFIRYVLFFLVPVDLSGGAPFFVRYQVLLLSVFTLGAVAAIYLLRKRLSSKPFLFGASVAILTFLPAANLFPQNRHALTLNLGLAIMTASLVRPLFAQAHRRRRLAAGLLTLWLVLLAGQSIHASAIFRTASRLSRSVVEQTVTLVDSADAPANLIVLTAPDAYRGAFVLRNGLHQALQLLRPEKNLVVHTMVLAGVRDLQSPKLTIQYMGASGYDIRLDENAWGYLLLPDGNWSRHQGDRVTLGAAHFTIVDEPHRFNVRQIQVRIDPDLLYFSKNLVVAYVEGKMTSSWQK